MFLSRHQPAAKRPPSTVRRVLYLEEMESREVPAAFVVTNTSDDPSFAATGSLRWAILNANGTPGRNTIQFAIPGTGVQTIFPLAALPTITNPVVIDGATQAGYTTTPMIQLNGAKMSGNGLVISAGQSVVRSLAINQFSGDGIELVAGGGNLIQANFIGTDPTASRLLGNGTGVHDIGSSGNAITSNTIAGNIGDGIHLSTASGTLIQSNYIGLNSAGGALPNGTGVEIDQRAAGNNVLQNTISGNRGDGISLHDSGTFGNVFSVNFLGTDPTAQAAVSNGNAGVEVYAGASANQFLSDTVSGNGVAGVWLHDTNTSGNVFQYCFVGTDNTGENPIANGAGVVITSGASGNNFSFGVVSGNRGSGVTLGNSGTAGNLISTNLIGVDASGTRPIGNGLRGMDIGMGASANQILRNIVSGNAGSGILIYGASQNYLENDLCGLNQAGNAAMPNGGSGLEMQQGASGNVIQSSVFSGNLRDGIFIHDRGTDNNALHSDPCGTDGQGRAAVPNGANGVEISAGSQGTTFEAITLSGNKLAGLYIHDPGTSKANVRDCFIGVDGTADPGNFVIPNGIGVVISNGASGNAFGFNEISGNIGGGMLLQGASGNLLQGNFFGTNYPGTGALPNGNYGLAIVAGSTGNIVGGGNDVANTISGNRGLGLWIDGGGTTGNYIGINIIGVDVFESVPLNNYGDGVKISGGANHNTITRNLIGGNFGNGIEIRDAGTTANTISTNYVGTDPTRAKNFGNQFWGIIQYSGAAGNILQDNIVADNGAGGIFGG